ncbi:hypothetical protein [Pararhizobium sp.]|uniref:hypothetical protein n=1 Tax=Pararhizobium sp. TaxID=1977563 RepID=UPI0027251B1D|nr:hypothetical protein [Pararhizobium sp.]MDO9418276.1 hypothetical protein [Pararhizobium sp.]
MQQNRPNYLSKEESFMYDREANFKMHETRNEARIQYTENGVQNLSSRRCEVLHISRSGAVLGIVTQFKLPPNFYLEIPSARIGLIGAVLKKVHASNTIEIRFLTLISDKDLNKVFVFSTHPNHRNMTLDLRG